MPNSTSTCKNKFLEQPNPNFHTPPPPKKKTTPIPPQKKHRFYRKYHPLHQMSQEEKAMKGIPGIPSPPGTCTHPFSPNEWMAKNALPKLPGPQSQSVCATIGCSKNSGAAYRCRWKPEVCCQLSWLKERFKTLIWGSLVLDWLVHRDPFFWWLIIIPI